MKLSKEQLVRFEEILSSQGYKKQSYSLKREDFSWYKVIHKSEDYSVSVSIDFYDFSKYPQYEPANMAIGFDTEICIVDNTLPTTLQIPFCENEDKSIFNYYDPEPEDKQYYKPREFKTEEVLLFLHNLENIALAFNEFYLDHLNEHLKKSFRKK